LCFGFEHTTRKTPPLRIILHSLHIRLSEARTFIVLYTSGDARSATVGVKLHRNPITYQHFDAVEPHLSGEVSQH
jgi:hypothetical protein